MRRRRIKEEIREELKKRRRVGSAASAVKN
uniref:Uncharacterized protein n=1 Tax=Nelumbo nucifera TaxID=4432 RepID=A0A822YKT0_NELNU|nr:TPA_asm: hypothetical protein HUJ06_012051 [Nelumbo nucifera]